MRFVALALLLLPLSVHAQTLQDSVRAYGDHVHASYAQVLTTAEELREAIHTFTATPSVVTHEMAKTAWVQAREAYVQTEVFRFYNGPIDREGGPEGLLNAWPLDEAYIDYVVGAPAAGIIGNTTEFPEITKELLIELNELDGEKNISTGYHAIEFLLWGQDFFADGPGQRSFEDYLTAPNADRRARYLNLIADMLVADVAGLESEWRADGAYRAEFSALQETAAMKKILAGIIFMAGDELSGERMYVAYDSRGQEDEQSCFSDTTHMDIQWNYWGVENVIKATGLLELPEVKGTALAARIADRMTNIRAMLAGIPAPFDQAIVNEGSRSMILASIDELEALALDLVEVSVLLKARVEF